jgi:transcriptional regulator with XRE-family HTH domain
MTSTPVRTFPDKKGTKSSGPAFSREQAKKNRRTIAIPGSSGGASRAHVMRGQDRVEPVTPGSSGAAAAGQLLREFRRAAGLSERGLAKRSAVARSTVTRLEHGQIRPRRSLLQALAVGLDPDRPKELAGQLAAAAGDDVVPESDRWRHYRQRRLERGILRGDVPLPARVAESLRLHRAADVAWSAGVAILRRPGALDDADALDKADELLIQARVLRDQAGPPMTLIIGKVRITAGVGVP